MTTWRQDHSGTNWLALAVLAAGASMLTTVSQPALAAASGGAAACTGAAPRTVTHVVVIVMENKDESSVIGSADAPYLNQLAAGCGLATSYHGAAHPSLPNYLAMTGGSTFGVKDDKPPPSHKIAATSIFGELGASWRSYQESMAVNCQKYGSGGLYAPKHNPAAYYTSLSDCGADDVPLPASPAFDAAFTFITPNLQHDMHDGTIKQGDDWVAGFVPKVLSSPQYQAGSLALFIVWDENDGPNHAAGNQVPLIVISPSVRPGTRCGSSQDHYSLLATWEDLLSVPRTGGAASATSLSGAFSL